MRKILLIVAVGLIAVAGFASRSAAAVVAGRTTLSGHVPAVVTALTSTGQLPATDELHLAIGLPVRNQAALDLLLSQITDPASPNFRQYLTTEQFTEQFCPTTNDVQAVVNFATANGLTVTAIHPNRMIVDVSGTVAVIQSAFQISLKTYQHPAESRTFYAPDTEPSVSSSLSILHVSGLDNYYIPHPKMVPLSQNPNGGATPNVGSGPGGAFMGNDFRTAYVPGTALTGAGQNVGLLQFDGFYASDIAAYASLIGLANPPNLVIVPIDGGVSVPGFGNGEVCLDIEMVFAMAPGVSNVYVYEAPNPSPWVDILSRMANDNLARQLSCSWGGGPQDAVAEQIFKQMALQGQSFYSASGDSDAFVDRINPISFPSDSPNITQVGGTTLTTGAAGDYGSEIVWNWGFPNLNGGYWGSCGGISSVYPIPSWQQGISMANNHGSTLMRNIPDVALTADNIWVTSDNGQAGAFGGTSCAAPLWAAFTALVNQQAAISNRPPVGFVNPAIYSLAKSGNYANVFNDVTVGDNTWPGSPTNFFAVAGYDLCTGLGTPKGTNLINALTSGVSTPVVIISAPRPPYGTTLSVMNGSNPNGPWFLFVQDDSAINTGIISNGWFLNLTTANPVGFAADNELIVTSSGASVLPNTAWTVALTVTNYGPSSSTNVIVSDILPNPGVTLVSSNATAGSVLVNNQALTWTVGNLSVNTGAKLTLNFFATSIGTYTNDASVAAATSDPNPDDENGITTLLVSSVVPQPQLTPSFNPATHAFQLAVSGLAGQFVTVQASTNLANPLGWAPVSTGTIPFTYTSFDSTNFPARFYRTLVGP